MFPLPECFRAVLSASPPPNMFPPSYWLLEWNLEALAQYTAGHYLEVRLIQVSYLEVATEVATGRTLVNHGNILPGSPVAAFSYAFYPKNQQQRRKKAATWLSRYCLSGSSDPFLPSSQPAPGLVGVGHSPHELIPKGRGGDGVEPPVFPGCDAPKWQLAG